MDAVSATFLFLLFFITIFALLGSGMAFMHLLGKLVLPEPDWENQIVDEFTLTDEELRAFDEEVADLFYDEKEKGPWAP